MTVRDHDIRQFIDDLGVEMPPEEDFWTLGDRTALRYKNGQFYRSNYERGMLLYALVVAHRPQVIMEFGTGRGYGTLCMAKALVDQGLDGKIYTVDILSPDSKMDWAIDWNDGAGPQVESLSWNDVWKKSVPQDCLNQIHFLTGRSAKSLRNYDGEPIDFAFIDAAHNYRGVRHDYYAVLNHASPQLMVLFDDYAKKPKFGVSKLINEEVAPHFDVDLLQTRRQETEEDSAEDAIYKMAWITTDTLNLPLRKTYNMSKVRQFLDDYYYEKFPTVTQQFTYQLQRFAKRWMLRIKNRLPMS